MNILVIGNGFDLAHGLPTKYTDFLKFCQFINKLYNPSLDIDRILKESEINTNNNLNEEKLINKICKDRTIYDEWREGSAYKCVKINKEYDEFYKNINNNFWIEYFSQCTMYQKEN